MNTIKVALAGAFGVEQLEAMQKIDGVEVVSLVSRDLDKTPTFAVGRDVMIYARIEPAGDLIDTQGGRPAARLG